MVTLKAKDGNLAAGTFRFAAAKVEGAELTYQRYHDADMAAAGPEVSLEQTYGSASRMWIWWVIAIVALVIAAAIVAIVFLRKQAPVRQAKWQLPAEFNPFTVLGLLKNIEKNNGFDKTQKEELSRSIALVERRFFAAAPEGEPDLRRLAEDWV